ncbi:MAG TPA: tetratricopeptide repeat protein [Thermoanaerobaculia bacterium]|nr:tetratricopeptide repeat protein [Thermoanaerobaculia bacterium]
MPISDTVRDALRSVRVGDYVHAAKLLEPFESHVPRSAEELRDLDTTHQTLLLRLITLLADISDHDGQYERAALLLLPHRWIVSHVEQTGTGAVSHEDMGRDERKLLRQRLYFIWMLSVLRYRQNRFAESAELLALARDVAERMVPRANGILTQVYYGSAKIALHGSDFPRATVMYRKSLVSASLLSSQRRRKSGDNVVSHETAAAQYSIGKALALGLGQCLRAQGRLEEAHMSVVAGKLLLDLGEDTDLSYHAWLLLGSIERGTAGRSDKALLESARKHLEECAVHFERHLGDVWFRSRNELGLVLLQQGQLDDARREMGAVLDRARERESNKWMAHAYLGLSRIERRAGEHEKAEDAAHAALGKHVSKLETRARLTYAHALHDRAVATADKDLDKLHKAELELKNVKIDTRDLRNRPMLLLLQARVFHAKGDERAALEAYEEFEKLEHLVEVGRVREFAQDVKAQLMPALDHFRCPADDAAEPDYNKGKNLDALMRHLVTTICKVPGLTDTQRARKLGMSRPYFADLKAKYGV